MKVRKWLCVVLSIALVTVTLSGCKKDPPVPPVKPDKAAAAKLFPAWNGANEGKLWGFINDEGKFVIEPKWKVVGYFMPEGYAVVLQDNLKGVINTKGQMLVQPKYTDIVAGPGERIVGVRENGWYELINLDGKLIYESENPIKALEQDWAIIQEYSGETARYGYLNAKGESVKEPTYLSATPYVEEHAIVGVGEGKFQIIDRDAKVMAEFSALEVKDPKESCFAYRQTSKKEPLWGYKNFEGDTIIKPSFVTAEPFIGGLAVVSQRQKGELRYGIIDKKGKFLIRPKYALIKNLGNTCFAVTRTADTIGNDINTPEGKEPIGEIAIFDSQGTRLTDYIYTRVNGCGNDYVSVTNGIETSLLGINGKPAAGFAKYVGNGNFSSVGSKIVAVVDEEMYYLTLSGKEIWKAPEKVELDKRLKLKKNKYRPDKERLIYYPEVEGLENKEIQKTINALLVKAFTSETALGMNDVKALIHYDAQINKDLLIVKASGFVTDDSGVEREVLRYMHFNMETGEQYLLKDLFGSSDAWRTLLRNRVKASLAAEQLGEVELQPIDDERSFKITKYGVEVYYLNSELGLKGSGFKKVVVPYFEILQSIVTERAFWNSFLKQDM